MQQSIARTLSLRLEESARRCAAKGVVVSGNELEWMLESATGLTRLEWVMDRSRGLAPGWAEAFESMMVRRLAGEPVQYILSVGHFYGRDFAVGPEVLIPRPETELLVEWAIQEARKQDQPRILDIGTGSGCIAVTMALEVPGAEVTAVDLSPGAIGVAMRNAESLGARVRFAEVDVLSEPVPGGPFSMLLSNPPYVPLSELESLQVEVREFEPHMALFAGEDALLFYRRIADIAPVLIEKGGLLGVEIHMDYADSVVQLFRGQRFLEVEVRKDLSGKDRFVTARVG
jgi:release factor glutamine methyltransferase